MIGESNDCLLSSSSKKKENEPSIIAFYLPQYHRIKENSEWWGTGFTEWVNVAKAQPNFKGHYQPHIPRDLGFYDLSNVEVMREQAMLAHDYGVHGFCFYYYWFSGRRILERPLDNFLASDIDMPFCLCWANENWTRTWDGMEKDVLLKQNYADGDEEKFISDIYPFLIDSRYIRVDGKPLLVIYYIKHMPNPAVSIEKMRKAAESLGLIGLHVSVVDYNDITDPREVGADAMIEFPPHKFGAEENRLKVNPKFTNKKFCGHLFDYRKIAAQSIRRLNPPFTLYRGIVPSWDNIARRQDTGVTFVNSNPNAFGIWLKYLRIYTQKVFNNPEKAFIFINAWNEWGEGCHLEPDLRWERGYLEEIIRSMSISAGDQMSIEHARDTAIRQIERIPLQNDEMSIVLEDSPVLSRAILKAALKGCALNVFYLKIKKILFYVVKRKRRKLRKKISEMNLLKKQIKDQIT